LEATQTLEQWFEQADNALPVLTQSARVAVVGLGLVLWLAGGRLLKAACIFGGAMLGMILGGLVMAFVDSAGIAIASMIGLGLIGALGAWLMFRAWVAMAAALVLAIAAPAAMIVWQGTPTDTLAQDTKLAAEQLETRYNQTAEQLSDEARNQVRSLIDQGDRTSLVQADQVLAEQGVEAASNARGVIFRNLESMQAWWREHSTEAQRTVGIAMLIGAGIGFLLGLMAPNYAAAVQSAIVGAVLIVVPGRELVLTHLPDAKSLIPTTAQGILLTTGLITLVGLALQWTLYLRRDDK